MSDIQKRTKALLCAISLLRGEIHYGYAAQVLGPDSHAIRDLREYETELLELLKEVEDDVEAAS